MAPASSASRLSHARRNASATTSPAEGLPVIGSGSWSDTDSVLNGIAWDAKKKRLFVTGKNWPKLYEIALADCH